MLSNEIIKKIEDFVYSKPRSIQEVALHIGKNWRTADRYIQEIETDFGTLSTKVFREGTRGALKIVFWSSVEKVSSSVFQQNLEEQILKARRKEEFSPFDIFQYVGDKDKEAYRESNSKQTDDNLRDYARLLEKAEKQVLIFSGNLSFINLKGKNFDMMETFESLIKKKIPIKVLCRVDLAGKSNVEKLLSLNFKHGKEMIEIRHHDQPIRGAIIDNKRIRLKEVNIPTLKKGELKEEVYVIYNIKNKEWSEWLSKIFWKMFSSSIDAKVRLVQMNKLKELR